MRGCNNLFAVIVGLSDLVCRIEIRFEIVYLPLNEAWAIECVRIYREERMGWDTENLHPAIVTCN
jgi:hypothetical protein